MVRRPRSGFVVAALAAAALGVYFLARPAEPTSAPGDETAGPERPERTALPRIALSRLDHGEAEEASPPARDIFRFGRTEAPAAPVAPSAPPSVLAAQPPATAAGPTAAATPPPLAVRYIGSIERQGLKVAVLMSEDKQEILTGREGDTVANRLKIVHIGLESVDVQDLGSERTRRIPLRGK